MDDTTLPTAEMLSAFLSPLVCSDMYELSTSDVWSGLIDVLDDNEAQMFPDVIGELLPLLRGDLDRFNFLIETIIQFDLFEAAEPLVSLAVDRNDDEMLDSAAALCGNPGVEPELRGKILQATDSRISRIRMDASLRPVTEEEKLVYEQEWPGSRPAGGNPRSAAVAVLDTSLPATQVLKLSARMQDAGMVVRRMPFDEVLPDWFGPQTFVVCSHIARRRLISELPDFPKSQIAAGPALAADSDYDNLLKQVNSAVKI